MRAVVCTEWGPPERLEIKSLPDPVPQDGEVLIEMRAAGVNYPDGLIIQNKYQVKPALPFIPGNECAGVVRAVGARVQGFSAGDRVIALPGIGTFAEQLCCPQNAVVKIPDEIDFKTAAAFMLAYATSYHALCDRGQLAPGETLLVLGASGGVGLAAVEIGKALGARVLAAASSDEKLEICRQHGADVLINYSREDLKTRLAELTNGRGVDVAYDPVGGPFTEIALRGCAWRGRLLIVGFANGAIPKLPANIALLKGCSIIGVIWGRYRSIEPDSYSQDVTELLTWLKAGKLRPHIAEVYPLDETPQAISRLLNRTTSGKVVIVPA